MGKSFGLTRVYSMTRWSAKGPEMKMEYKMVNSLGFLSLELQIVTM
jgi:hypothetical protein